MKIKTGLQSGSFGKRLACVDFDHVLMSPASPWPGASVATGDPVPGARQFMEEVTKNYRVGIFSSRNFEPGGIAAMKGWLQTNGFPVSELEFPTSKSPCFALIDDRAIPFSGTFPAMEEIGRFLQW
ncbi:MAG: hypothetical protein DRI57_05860 [Deltaproteobacteria bacterium]|nr:MAG: hypothetical protein DRI57_05860 [Deltaproteobacteria bacterium]